jgi:hypothetical protein
LLFQILNLYRYATVVKHVVKKIGTTLAIVLPLVLGGGGGGEGGPP